LFSGRYPRAFIKRSKRVFNTSGFIRAQFLHNPPEVKIAQSANHRLLADFRLGEAQGKRQFDALEESSTTQGVEQHQESRRPQKNDQ
jgi:hypothetical protein